MQSTQNFNSPPLSEGFICSCDKVYHKRKYVFFVLIRSDFSLTIQPLFNELKLTMFYHKLS